jgi:hypothetical protein
LVARCAEKAGGIRKAKIREKKRRRRRKKKKKKKKDAEGSEFTRPNMLIYGHTDADSSSVYIG